MSIINEYWPIIWKVYLAGYIIVFIGSRIMIAAQNMDKKWTLSERWKVVGISLLSWLAVVIWLYVLLYSWLENKIKINWKKRVWL